MTDTTTDHTAPLFWTTRQPGKNVDPIDVAAGLRKLQQLGWDPQKDARTFTVIEYALQRWARGEEHQAQRLAIAQGETDPRFKDAAVDLTSWYVVLAAAVAAGRAALEAAAS